MRPWYIIDDIDRLDTPALVVYPERVQHNIALLKSSIDEVSRLRIHVKTHKSLEATQLLLDAGITKFKCATIAEAEMLGMCQAPDVLLAYQPTGPKVNRFVNLIKEYPQTKFSCLIDNYLTANELSDALISEGLVANIFIDLNVGMNRTGIVPGDAAFQLYKKCALLPGLRVKGLHAYDGHIHTPDLQLRRRQCDAAFTPVLQLQQHLIQAGLPKPVIVAGGSPTFPIHAERADIECSPGTFIYWDWGYSQQLPEQHYLPAALVVTRVVSVPSATQVCLDAGHKAVGSENGLDKRIQFLNAPELKITGHSEEHLMAVTEAPHQFKVGDVLYGLPWHICPTVALYEHMFVVKNAIIRHKWQITARNRTINI